MRILGVDPGSRLTGYGCVDLIGNQLRHVAHGTLRLANTSGKATIPLEERLFGIHEGLSKVIREHSPEVFAVEKVFFAKNAVSALKLGQARGAVILTGRMHGLRIFEYSPTEVKQAIVGQGHADKEQVARMVRLLLGLSGGKGQFETSDASDGLALAICHAHATKILGRSGEEVSRALQAASGRRSRKRMSLAECVGAALPSRSGGKER